GQAPGAGGQGRRPHQGEGSGLGDEPPGPVPVLRPPRAHRPGQPRLDLLPARDPHPQRRPRPPGRAGAVRDEGPGLHRVQRPAGRLEGRRRHPPADRAGWRGAPALQPRRRALRVDRLRLQPLARRHGQRLRAAPEPSGVRGAGGRALTLYESLLARRDAERARRAEATLVVDGDAQPWEDTPQGRPRWYLHPDLDDRALRTLGMYVQEIPPRSRSGRYRWQGGEMIVFLAGRGTTEVDGERFEWEAG